MQPGNTVTWGALKQQAEEAMKALTEGTRITAVVEEAGYKMASTGSHMVAMKLAVTEGPHANRKLFNNLVLSPDNAFAMTMFFRNMAAFGVTDQVFASLESVPGGPEQHLAIIGDAIIGRKVTIVMAAPRAFQGVERDNIGTIESVPGQPALNLNIGLPAGGTTATSAATGGPPVPNTNTTASTSGVPPIPSF